MRRRIGSSLSSGRTTCCFSNFALAGQAAGCGISGRALSDDATFSVTLDSGIPNLGHTVQVDLPRLAPAVCCKSQSFL